MPRIRFTVAYRGTGLCGWQKQKHMREPSAAGMLEAALKKVLNEPISLYASGRTDAGVHALNQVCHFDTTKIFPSKWDFCWAMNSQLPDSIAVKEAWIAPDDFHATISATHKTYRYLVLNRHRPSPFLQPYSHWVRKPLDLDFLNKCSEQVVGRHDFKSFMSEGTPVKSTVRRVLRAQWRPRANDVLEFSITGTGFLKQMVRNIVGTQLMIERKGLPIAEMGKILHSLDRKQAGPPAPAEGLYLYKVYYPRDLDNQCRAL